MVTVVGLPVSAVLAGFSCILGVVSVTVSKFQKSMIKSAITDRQHIGSVRKAITELDMLGEVCLDKSYNMISADVFSRGKSIYKESFKKSNYQK